MLFVFLCSLVVYNFIHGSEQPTKIPDDTPITISFPRELDANQQPQKIDTTFGIIKHFETLRNTTTIFNRPKEIPLSDIKKPVFECLINLLKYETEEQNPLKLELTTLHENFEQKFNKSCNSVSRFDLLTAGHFLQAEQKVFAAIASLYAKELLNKKPDDIIPDLELPIIQGLLQNLITDPRIEGELTTIPVDYVHSAPVFTNTGIAWLEEDGKKITLFYYDFLTSQLPRSIAKVVSPGTYPLYLPSTQLGVDIKANVFCIGALQNTEWLYTNVSLNNIKNMSTVNIPLIQGSNLYDIVYDTVKQRFTAIYENRDHRFIILKPIVSGAKEKNTIYPRYPIDTNRSNNVKHLWNVLGRYFVRFMEHGVIQQSSLLVYDSIDKKIIFDNVYSNYAHSETKPLQEIEIYGYATDVGMVHGLVSEIADLVKITQCITPHPLIPEYNNLISTRATGQSVKNIIEKWPTDMGFDVTQLCYVTHLRKTFGKNSLLVYSLLPHSTRNAIREITEDENMKDQVLQVWYTVHASLKTEQWKNLDQETKDKIDPKISKFLPFYERPPQGWSLARIGNLFKRDLGTLQQKTNYFRYVYSQTIKNMALAAGMALAGYVLFKTGSYLIRQINSDKPNLPSESQTYIRSTKMGDVETTITPETIMVPRDPRGIHKVYTTTKFKTIYQPYE